MIIRGVLKLVARVVGGIVSRAAAKKQPKGCATATWGWEKEAAGVVGGGGVSYRKTHQKNADFPFISLFRDENLVITSREWKHHKIQFFCPPKLQDCFH